MLACAGADIEIDEALATRSLHKRTGEGCHRIGDTVLDGGRELEGQVLALRALALVYVVDASTAFLERVIDARGRAFYDNAKLQFAGQTVTPYCAGFIEVDPINRMSLVTQLICRLYPLGVRV